MHVAVAIAAASNFFPALTELHDAFNLKAKDFSDVLMVGRTHLMDALPMQLGQVIRLMGMTTFSRSLAAMRTK